MGNCDTICEDNSKKNGKIIYSNGLKQNIITNSKENGQSSKSTLTKYCFEKGEFILPLSICKRDDVSKYYKLSSNLLGSGASGQVFIGEKDNQKFAIKKISKTKIKYVEDALLEAKISLSLSHKNIIKYYEIFEDLKYITYVMELGEGGDLFDFITGCPTGHLPDDIAIDLIIQMFEVVDYLHSKVKVIHRDLKPENFMVTIDKNNKPIIKLIDFGLAAYIPDGDKKLKTLAGTAEYASPEICAKTGYREKVDEWSLGVIIFNMLTGFEPFNGIDKEQLKDNIIYGTIQFDYIQNNDLRDLDTKLLERNVSKRICAKDGIKIANKIKNKIEEELPKETRCNSPQVRRSKITQNFENFWSNIQNNNN